MDDIKTYFNWSPNEWHTEGRKNVADILNKLDDNYETKAKGEDYSHKADLCRSLWLAIQTLMLQVGKRLLMKMKRNSTN